MFVMPFQPWTDLTLTYGNEDFTLVGSGEPATTYSGDILNRSPYNGINNADDLP